MGRRRTRLPGALTEVSFPVSKAARLGVGSGRLRGADLDRPFHGVRAEGTDLTRLVERCRALSHVLGAHHVFSHLTAAELWRMPLPAAAAHGSPLDVLSVDGRDGVRRPGVTGRSTRSHPERRRHRGLSLTSPAEVWCQLADPALSDITRDWLVAIGDFLVSGERTDFGRNAPLCTIEELAAAVDRHGSRPGAPALRWALARVRMPVDSVRETFLRLALVGARLPEPVVQLEVATRAGDRHADLGYPNVRLLLEYLGDAHRTSRRRWLDDLTRVQLFQDAGWRVMLIGAADLEPDARALIARVRSALQHPFA